MPRFLVTLLGLGEKKTKTKTEKRRNMQLPAATFRMKTVLVYVAVHQIHAVFPPPEESRPSLSPLYPFCASFPNVSGKGE